jgi:hypothetical protein
MLTRDPCPGGSGAGGGGGSVRVSFAAAGAGGFGSLASTGFNTGGGLTLEMLLMIRSLFAMVPITMAGPLLRVMNKDQLRCRA